MPVGPNPWIEGGVRQQQEELADSFLKGRPLRRWWFFTVRSPLELWLVRPFDRRIREQMVDCAGLGELQLKSKGKLSYNLTYSRLDRISLRKHSVVSALILVGIGTFLIYWYSNFVPSYSEVATWIKTTVPFAATMLLIAYFVWYYTQGRIYERRAAWRTFKVCQKVEAYAAAVSHSTNRMYLMKRIERVARTVERIPFNYRRGVNRSTSQQLFLMAGERAAHIRQLNVWVAAPLPTTRADLDAELLYILEHLIQGRWAHLRVASLPTSPKLRHTQRIALIAFAVALVGGLVAVNLFSKQLGPVATIVFSAIGVGLAIVLPRSGLAIETLQQGMSLGPKLTASEGGKAEKHNSS